MKSSAFFSASFLDRMEKIRKDRSAVSDLRKSDYTRYIVIDSDRHLVPEKNPGEPVYVNYPRLNKFPEMINNSILLGRYDGNYYFAAPAETTFIATIDKNTDNIKFRDIRWILPEFGRINGSLLTMAKSMVHWSNRVKFCGKCGSPTELINGGSSKKCKNPDCGEEYFPRIEPSIIVLVEYEGDAFLARQVTWREGFYSTLAGFVETSESLEEAVIREVKEESDIDIEQPVYFGSDPWPFPASLMLGFFAKAKSKDFKLDENELETGRWFKPKEYLTLIKSGEVKPSLPVSISFRLISRWIKKETGQNLGEIIEKL